jgi:RNA polymerase-binding transcription factor DksA
MRATPCERLARDRLQRRRSAIMARYPVRDEGWVQQLTDDDARRLLAIFEAMRRLDFGSYGLCMQCGSVIDAERLSALPEAAICVVCATFAAIPHAHAAQ